MIKSKKIISLINKKMLEVAEISGILTFGARKTKMMKGTSRNIPTVRKETNQISSAATALLAQMRSVQGL